MGAMIFFIIFMFAIGFVYPAAGVVYYKAIKHSKKGIREILDEL